MTVEVLITALKELDPKRNIIMPWWTKEDFPNVISNEVEWVQACRYLESEECWEGITAQLEEIIKNQQETDVVTGEKKVVQETK
tara:strand:- start:4670 stop:4921 length:252 start_codon:yes stop_codon:yes gene_type:complete